MRRKRSRVYFTKDTENAIVEYNTLNDPKKKQVLYKEKIEYPLNKMVENIINRFKFPYFYDSTDNIKQEVVSFLIANLHKYDQEKGRAFSYFSVITKNYLIIENRSRYEHIKIHHSIDNTDENLEILDEEKYEHAVDDTNEFIDLFLEFWENNLTTIFKKKKEIMIADAVLELFRQSHNIENFNKKALYVMIREMTGVKQQYITSVVNKMKEHTYRLLREFNEQGIFSTDNIEEYFY